MKNQIDACIKHQEESASTCSSTANSNATTWSNTSARTSTASCSPRTRGCSPTAHVASSLRSCGATESRANPITVEWSAYAQSRTDHVMKGMLTGPVTILNWSWPREDITHEQQTQQLALAIRDEVLDLEKAGIKVIQIDEAALREKLPLRKTDWHKKYLDWAIPAFRLVHSAVKPTTADPHAHVLFGVQRHHPRHRRDGRRRDLLRSLPWRSVVLDAIHDANFETEAGPGVTTSTPRAFRPNRRSRTASTRSLKKMDVEKVWINPDCGLKTRGNAETWPSLENLVAAAKAVRAKLAK